jgi:nicotinamide phosphoribosyltransferase
MSIITDTDSYKFSHFALYPEGTSGMFSYIEARAKGQTIVPFGLQMWIKKNLLVPITQADIDEAADIAGKHGVPFNRQDWEYILEEHAGYLPIKIRGLPEGVPIASGTPFVTVECTDSRVFWLASYIETSLQRGIWYPTTIASRDRENYKQLEWFYNHASDNPDMLPFSLHSFGSRGVSSKETAEIGGLAHLVYFMGTDDVVALEAARKYYSCDMAGYSVCATEHSLQCSYGKDNQEAYFNRILDAYAKPGAIVSVVMDGYDIMREVDLLCTKFKDRIIASGAKWVCRPDSGDMMEIVPEILRKLAAAFGTTVNSKGKHVLNNVSVIQGDGIDSTTLAILAQKVNDAGFAPECVIYGSGGGLLQKVNRDTYSFAQKTSAVLINGVWVDTVKDPITDPGKKSKGGRLDSPEMVTFYENGKLLVDVTLQEISNRAK